MTIEELFGTLQQSVVSTWRKHLRTAKYSKHMALNDFYEEMPDKVDALIEAWMGVNGRKIKSYDNILQSKNMNTLSYLKELRRVVKQGYALMNGEAELEAKLDDIVELIDSTLYKVKELSENKTMKDLKDFVVESLTINESVSFLDGCGSYPDNWDLVSIFRETDGGNSSKLKSYDWADYFDEDFVEAHKKDIIDLFTNFFAPVNSISNDDLGNLDEGSLDDEEVRDDLGIDEDHGVALHKDGDDGTWTVITFTKDINKLPSKQEKAIFNLISKYEDAGYYIEWWG